MSHIAIDDGSRAFEDFVAITDLAAGAFAEVASQWENSTEIDPLTPHLQEIDKLSSKSGFITDWHSEKTGALRKVSAAIRHLPDGRLIVHRVESQNGEATI